MQAGRSLGFDLKGSLAAINQWVEQMDSDDENDDDDDGSDVPLTFSSQRGAGAGGLFSRAGDADTGRRDVSFAADGAGSLASDHSCSGSSQTGGQSKILSREKILYMVSD